MNILIIGATSGIGRALFEKYVSDGNHLGIVGRRANLLEELQLQHPDNTFAYAADITKQDEVEQAIHTLCEKLGNIAIAIVCSGIGDLNPLLVYALEHQTIETNVKGWTFVIDTLYHIFEKQGYGHLVAITSIGGLRGEPMSPAYSATKAYQINYIEALRKKAFKNGGHITVTDIRPGLARHIVSECYDLERTMGALNATSITKPSHGSCSCTTTPWEPTIMCSATSDPKILSPHSLSFAERQGSLCLGYILFFKHSLYSEYSVFTVLFLFPITILM